MRLPPSLSPGPGAARIAAWLLCAVGIGLAAAAGAAASTPPTLSPIVATFAMPVTTYTISAPTGGTPPYHYKWTNSNSCGTFLAVDAPTAEWSHPDSSDGTGADFKTGPCPNEPVHPGVITVTVTDANFVCTESYPNGSAPGGPVTGATPTCTALAGTTPPATTTTAPPKAKPDCTKEELALAEAQARVKALNEAAAELYAEATAAKQRADLESQKWFGIAKFVPFAQDDYEEAVTSYSALVTAYTNLAHKAEKAIEDAHAALTALQRCRAQGQGQLRRAASTRAAAPEMSCVSQRQAAAAARARRDAFALVTRLFAGVPLEAGRRAMADAVARMTTAAAGSSAQARAVRGVIGLARAAEARLEAVEATLVRIHGQGTAAGSAFTKAQAALGKCTAGK